MMKTIKGKVVTGVVTIGLLSGVGAAFADTDAGQALQNWYNGQFGKSAASIQNDSVKHIQGKVGALNTEYNNLKSNVKSQIDGESAGQVTAKTTSINNAKDGYIQQVSATKADISSKMTAQFDGITAYANTIITQAGVQAQNYANKELTKQAGENGAAAITDMDGKILAAQDQAKKDLQAAIDNAKKDLSLQLAGETTDTTQGIKDAIDAKIVELRGLINQKAQDLVDAQKTLIQQQANLDEQNAKTELENVVKGI